MDKENEKYIVLWYSKVVLNFQSSETKSIFRKLETAKKKLSSSKLHLEFNEICIKKLVANIHQYIYIYIWILHIYE